MAFKFTKIQKRLFSNSVLFECSPTKVHKCLHPKPKLMVSKNEMLSYFKKMVAIRKMELKSDTIYKSGLIRGFCHLYDGQEAVGVGIEESLGQKDHLITAYRCHGQQYLRGDSIKSIFAEMLGKKTGSSKGKGGSMHLYLPEKNFYGGNGIVGAQIPVGGGIALACKYKKTDQVVVAMMGDGASNQGQVYETANIAALWKLPLIILIENNFYGMGTSSERSSYSKEYYTRGDYVPGIQCDGLDLVSSLATMQHAIQHCRSGKGPIFVEMKTYRYHGHSMSDPGKSYRKSEEVKHIRKWRDPIKNVRDKIISAGWATGDELKVVERDIGREVDEAVAEAKRDVDPPLEEAFSDIYFEERPLNIRGPEKVIDYGVAGGKL